MRWSRKKKDYVETPEIDVFIREIAEVCERHGLSISHEDEHGSFVIRRFDPTLVGWLQEATDDLE